MTSGTKLVGRLTPDTSVEQESHGTGSIVSDSIQQDQIPDRQHSVTAF
jgi:hypothetical protein